MILAFSLIASFVMLYCLVSAIARYWTLKLRIKKLSFNLDDSTEKLKTTLLSSHQNDWGRLVKRNWNAHPCQNMIIQALQQPQQAVNAEALQARLERDINRRFEDLSRGSQLAVSNVPMIALMFTTMGIAYFSWRWGNGASQTDLMMIMATAILTTTVGAFIYVLEKQFLLAKLRPYQSNLYEDGERLIECLINTILKRKAKQPVALAKARSIS